MFICFVLCSSSSSSLLHSHTVVYYTKGVSFFFFCVFFCINSQVTFSLIYSTTEKDSYPSHKIKIVKFSFFSYFTVFFNAKQQTLKKKEPTDIQQNMIGKYFYFILLAHPSLLPVQNKKKIRKMSNKFLRLLTRNPQ